MTATMSPGILPYDFVQQVYYLQEKTLLDFWPQDDKFREVLMEANIVLQELQAQQDWTWLRETLLLGDTSDSYGEIIEFKLPEDVYKVSALNHDCLRLYRGIKNEEEDTYEIDERRVYQIPIASAGDQRWNREKQVNIVGVNHVHDFQLRAVIHGDTIKLNRTLLPWEDNFIVAVDVQKRIEQFHICPLLPSSCSHATTSDGKKYCTNDVENSQPKLYLKEIPDPNYVIVATAARHAEGSPPALARVASLQDQAQRILSQMRQNDSDATDSDYIEWDLPGYTEVI